MIRMPKIKSLNEILSITDCNKLVADFYGYLLEKKNSNRKLNDVEEVVYLLVSMLPDIEMEGFIDLFHQLYSLRECLVIEQNLRQFGLHKLADLFSEGKALYIKSRIDITQEEYEEIDISAFDETQNSRFNEIGDLILAKDSEIYQLGEYICQFIKSNSVILQNNHE